MAFDQCVQLPCGNRKLLDVLRRSTAWAAIRPMVVDGRVIDGWENSGRHYFIFELRPDADAAPGAPCPVALFEMSWEQRGPHAALLLTPAADGGHVAVTHWRNPVVCCRIRARGPRQGRSGVRDQITESEEDSAISR